MKIINYITIADIFTIANALFGFSSIIAISKGLYFYAIAFILLAILMDGIDGIVARFLNQKGPFGAYLDITSDTVSFCIAPCFFLYTLYFTPTSIALTNSVFWTNTLLLGSCFILISFGMLRLARFCVLQSGDGETFIGLPVPASALMIVLIIYVNLNINNAIPLIAIILTVIILSILMISNIEYPKFKGRSFVIPASLISVSVALQQYFNNLASQVALVLASFYVFGTPFYLKWKYANA